MKRFQDKVVVITGAAKGVGAACARQFSGEGARVALFDLDHENGAALAEALGKQARFFACDVADEASVAGAYDQLQQWQPSGPDCLINNAGILGYTPVHETSLSEWNRIMGVNITGQFLCAKYAIPFMLKKRHGAIVNLGSAQSFMSQRKVAPYVTSKTAVLGLTRSIAVDYAPQIRCNAVCPSTIDTPMLHWALEQSPDADAVMREVLDMHLLKRVAQPEEIAELITFLCSDAAANITGQAFRSDGGIGILIEGSKQD